jgi:hypothetical protein
MSDEIAITGIRLVRTKPYVDGSQLIAFFDCRARGIALAECTLIRRKNGTLRAFPPKVDTRQDGSRHVRFVDESLATAVRTAAHEKFLAIGGVEAA